MKSGGMKKPVQGYARNGGQIQPQADSGPTNFSLQQPFLRAPKLPFVLVICYTKRNKARIVCIHGMDTPQLSEQHRQTREAYKGLVRTPRVPGCHLAANLPPSRHGGSHGLEGSGPRQAWVSGRFWALSP